ncbi:4a-hydroxytetrahydrobiopterin dehydratase [Limnochorda pilosa]
MRLLLTTHGAKGLTDNDVQLARRIEAVALAK